VKAEGGKVFAPVPGHKFNTGGFFSVFMLYLFAQTVRSLLLTDDWRLIRFIIMFGTLWGASYWMNYFKSLVPSPRTILRLVAWSCCVYMLAYLAAGYFADVREFTDAAPGAALGRFDLQYYAWSGTTVAVIPVFLALAAAFFQLREPALRDRLLGWGMIFSAILISFYYDSRLLMLGVLAGALSASPLIGIKRAIAVAALFCFVCVFFLPQQINGLSRSLRLYGTGMADSMKFLSDDVRDSDLTRKLDIVAAIRAAASRPDIAIFGYGWYRHREELISYRVEAGLDYGNYDIGPYTKIFRPCAFSVFLADTGILGILLLAGCFAETIRGMIRIAWRSNRNYCLPLVFCAAFFGLSLLVGISTDLTLFYFILMPSGVLLQLARYRRHEESPQVC